MDLPAQEAIEQADGLVERSVSTALQAGDRVVVEAGQIIPTDGEIVEGVASVDESAITGESAPVIREAGGDRSGVTGGTRVLSDRIVVEVTAGAGESFLDRMIALVEGRHPPEDAQRDRADDHPGRVLDHLPDRDARRSTRWPTLVLHDAYHLAHLRHPDADRAAGLPDPDDDRRPAGGDRHRRDGPRPGRQPDRQERQGGRGRRRHRHAAPGQDRHDHAGQPPGDAVRPAGRHLGRASVAGWPRWPRWPTRRPRARASSSWPAASTGWRSAAPARQPRSSSSPPRPG